jgi:hypothetical protein
MQETHRFGEKYSKGVNNSLEWHVVTWMGLLGSSVQVASVKIVIISL